MTLLLDPKIGVTRVTPAGQLIRVDSDGLNSPGIDEIFGTRKREPVGGASGNRQASPAGK